MKKKIFLSLLLAITFLFSACDLNDNDLPKTSEIEVFIPEIDNTPFTNPDMGWVFYDNAFQGHNISTDAMFNYYKNILKNRVQTIAVMSAWGYVEKEEGIYDWSLMDKSINYWIENGFDIHIRFCTDMLFYSADSAIGCPEYLYENYSIPYQERKVEGNNYVKFPDYNHPVYREKLALLLQELYDKYAEIPQVKMIDLRAFGLWGEWHTGYYYDNLQDRQDALQYIIDVWCETFQSSDKLLMLSASYDPDMDDKATNLEEFMRNSAFDYAMTKDNITIRRDGIGGAVFFGYKGRFDGQFVREFFTSGKRMPVVIEMMPGMTSQYYNFDRMFEEALGFNATLCSIYGADKAGVDTFINRYDLVNRGNIELGYRFVINRSEYSAKVSAGEGQNVRLVISNVGVGRAYKSYPMTLYVKDSKNKIVYQQLVEDFDATELIRGQIYDYRIKLKLPETLEEGQYTLNVGVFDEVSGKNIRLGISDGDANFLYPVGSFKIEKGYSTAQFKEISYGFQESDTQLKVIINDGEIQQGDILGSKDNRYLLGSAEENTQKDFITIKTLDSSDWYLLKFDYKIMQTFRNQLGFSNKFYVRVKEEGVLSHEYSIGGEVGYIGQKNIIVRKNAEIEIGALSGGSIAIDNIILRECQKTALFDNINIDKKETTGEFDDRTEIKNLDIYDYKGRLFNFTITVKENLSYSGYFYVNELDESGEIIREHRIYNRIEDGNSNIMVYLSPLAKKLVFGISGKGAAEIKNIYLLKD